MTLTFAGRAVYAQIVYTIPQKAGDFNRQAYTEISEDNLPDPISCSSNETQYYKIKLDESRIVKFLVHTDTITQNEEEWDDDSTPMANRDFNQNNPGLLDRLKREHLSEKEDIYKLLMPRLDKFINDNMITADYHICKEDCDEPLYFCGLSYMEYAIEESKFDSRLELGTTTTLNDAPPYKIERNWLLRFDYQGWVYFELTCGCVWDESLVTLPSPSQKPEELLISVHDPNSDIVWYKDVVFDSDKKPDQLACSKNQRQFFRNKIQFEKVYKNFRKDTVETNRRKWRIKEAEEFDRNNNEENAEDLKNDEAQDLDRLDINEVIDKADKMIEDSISRYWWNNEFAICIDDCDWAQCTWLKEVTFIKDPNVSYRYRARSAVIDTSEGKPYTAIVSSDMVVTYEGLVYFWIGCFCNEDYHVSTRPDPMNYDPEFWDPIQLTGEFAKPFLSSPGRFPYWIPITGGAVIGGVIYWLATKEEDKSLKANDDYLSLNCSGSGSINVLDNDKGKDLTLVNVEIISGNGNFTFEQSGRIIISNANESFVLRYTATDSDGKTISGTLTVDVQMTQIEANDDYYEIDENHTLNSNVLNNDIGTSLTVIRNTEPDDGALSIASDGAFSFVPDPDFVGSTSFTYEINGICGSQDQATVRIRVNDTTCRFRPMAIISPEICSSQNGSIELAITPPGNYQYTWSNGEITSTIVGLEAGEYRVNIFDPDNRCAKSYQYVVENESFTDFVVSRSVRHYSCLNDSTEISFQLTSPGNQEYLLKVFGPSGMEFNIETDQAFINLSDHILLVPGHYEILISDDSLGPLCSQTINITIEDQSPLLSSTDDYFQISVADTLQENILANDVGESLMVTDYNQPTIGIAEITSEGALRYIPEFSFTGQVSLNYVVKDSCHRLDTATITIEILQADCEFEFEIRTSPATCNREDGSAELIIEDSLEYTLLWSTGDTTDHVSELPSGQYTVAVTVIDNNGDTCTLDKDFDIANKSQEILDTVITKNANCKGQGELTLVIDSSQFDTIHLVLEGNGILIDTVLSGPRIDVHDWGQLDSGTYKVQLVEPGLADSCQQEIEIQIGQDTADFDIIITTENAFCGAATGKARARISPFGNYTFLWSNGETGNEIENLPQGRYYIDVTSEETGCSKSDTFEIERDDAAVFVEDQIIRPSACGQSGDIILELESPTGGNLRIVGSGPGVTINESVPQGTFTLSNFITVNAGNYRLTIWDENVGMQCSERLDVTVPVEDEDIDLQVIEIQEPSGPTASDGAILCEIVADPFSSPFLVFVNGAFNKTTTSPEFTIENLGVGAYTIYVISNTGCQSNEVTVEFDLSPLTLRISNGSIFDHPIRHSSDALVGEYQLFGQSITIAYSFESLFEVSALTYVGRFSNIFAVGAGSMILHDKWNLNVGSRIYFMNNEQIPGMYLQGHWPIKRVGQFSIESVTLKDGLNWRVLLNGGLTLSF